MDYVFVYGSLINSASRAITGRSGPGIPVRAQGFQRAWNFVSPKHRMTALGVVRRDGATTNGLLIPIAKEEMGFFDQREGGYTREPLDRTSVLSFDQRQVPDGLFWTYFPNNPGWPTIDCPILMSYVDVVMSGCLEIGEAFASEFVRTTALWDYPIENDRRSPRYPRAMQSVPMTNIIDRILRANWPIRGAAEMGEEVTKTL